MALSKLPVIRPIELLDENGDPIDAANPLPVTSSSGGVGTAIVTKADLVVGAASETPILVAADIPVGSLRVTVVNVGANPIRIKGAGEAGGVTRGLPLLANQAMSIGTGGALAALDGFSTLGTTLAFFFERD